MGEAKRRAGLQNLADELKRLLANWPTDGDRAETLAKEYRTIWDKVGPDRFAIAVTRIIHESQLRFFPSCGEFRSYIPDGSGRNWTRDTGCERCKGTGWQRVPDYEARRMYGDPTAMCTVRCNDCLRPGGFQHRDHADRAKNPDEYFGEADVVALMRIVAEKVAKKQRVDSEQCIAEVLAIRHACKEKGIRQRTLADAERERGGDFRQAGAL